MRRAIYAGIALAGAMVPAQAIPQAAAQSYRQGLHPGRLKGPPPGPPNDVLVLGTTHLASLPASFDMARLRPLLDRLAQWRPQVVATENLSGLQCDALRRYPQRYGKDTLDYCPDTRAAGYATGLDVPAANAVIERLLAAWPAQAPPDRRRRLAALFLAAGEPGSALVQWLRLPDAERRADAELPAPLVAQLEAARTARNETMQIAAPLAARLGLERLWSVDDHSADRMEETPEREAAQAAALARVWDNPALRERAARDRRLQAALDTPDGILALYRDYNAPDTADTTYRSDFGAALVEPSPERFGRGYLGHWETRNLRMVANIRDVLARQPGVRLLAIVGASHKGYYEAYLDQMHDVRLADATAVLRRDR